MRALVEQLGLSPNQVFGILRVAVTGQTVSPPLFESMEIVGKEKVLERVKQAIEMSGKDVVYRNAAVTIKRRRLSIRI